MLPPAPETFSITGWPSMVFIGSLMMRAIVSAAEGVGHDNP